LPTEADARRRPGLSARLAPFLAAASILVAAIGWLHVSAREKDSGSADLQVSAKLASVEARKDALLARLRAALAALAAAPDAKAALRNEPLALARAFRSLEDVSRRHSGLALAVRGPQMGILAWSGPASEIRGVPPWTGQGERFFAIVGNVTTLLVAAVPLPPGPGPEVQGFLTAEIPVRVRRNIENQFLSDFDLLAVDLPGVEAHYADVREATPEPFAAAGAGALARVEALRGPGGTVLGAVRAVADPTAPAGTVLARRYRLGVLLLATLAILGFTAAARSGLRPLVALLAVATTLRLLLLAVGGASAIGLADPALKADRSALGLVATAIDLLATALWAAIAALCLLEAALRRQAARVSPARFLIALAASLGLAVATFAWLAAIVARAQVDLSAVSLVPRSPAHLVLHGALLAFLAAALFAVTACFVLAGPAPRGALLGASFLLAAAAVVALSWPVPFVGWPPGAALLLLLSSLALAFASPRWRSFLAREDASGHAVAVLAVTGFLGLLLYATLAHDSEAGTRDRIEREYAPLVASLPQRRALLLEESARIIDEQRLLEDEAPEAALPGVEELAFAVWSTTPLREGGASAVEIQDAHGAVLSRFALDLPSLAGSGPALPLPPGDGWTTARESITVATAERPVLHARRRLSYDGQARGSVHLYVAEDYSGLPFLQPRDPYMALYRSTPRSFVHQAPLSLFAYDRKGLLRWSSAESAPELPPYVRSRLATNVGGVWETLRVEGEPARVFFFASGDVVHGLAYPRPGPGRFAANLLEAVFALGLAALVAIFLVMAARSLVGCVTFTLGALASAIRGRFALRLFAAFLLLALVPVGVLALARGFLTERLQHFYEDQALERAAFAQKAVADFALFQRREAPGNRPVTDPALIWVASLIRNDLDVFGRGRLLASSKRELYASGLLPPRLPGSVYRDLALEGGTRVLRTEAIGSFSGLVAFVPVALGGPEPAVLSIPLALRQRELQSTLDELDRALKVSALGFLVVAALAAHSMSRRISGPLRALTVATRRIADGDFAARVQTSNRDEILALVESFNRMAGDLERQRRDLEQSNRLAAWAEMARQVAHEVKNPLTPIQLSAEHLRRLHRDRSADFDALLLACTDTILKQVRKLRGIVTEFSAFARPPATAMAREDLGAIAEAVLEPYRRHLPPGVCLELDRPAGLPSVVADRRLVERALVNVLENALQAVQDQGSVKVQLRAREDPPRVCVEVVDSGPGLSPEARRRVFEPFFSTKSDGSGLGLALVKKIAEDHGGGVALESLPGEGARVVLWLPAAPA